MDHGDFKDLTRRKASDKILPDKAISIANNPKYDVYQRVFVSMVYKFFDNRISNGAIKNENMSNKGLPEEIHKPIIRKFKKRKVHSPFIDNSWGDDLTDKRLISKFIKGIRFLLCVIDVFSKYTWVISLKDKKGIIITNAFQKILSESNCKPNKIWADEGSEFCNGSMKSSLKIFLQKSIHHITKENLLLLKDLLKP